MTSEEKEMDRRNLFVIVAMLIAITACSKKTPMQNDAGVEKHPTPKLKKKSFKYTELPNTPEWKIKLKDPIVKMKKESCIWIPYLPVEIRREFPLPRGRDYYGMQFDQPWIEWLLYKNNLPHKEFMTGGSWSAFAVVKNPDMENEFDPHEWGFLIRYQGTFLAITLPDPTTIHVKKIRYPDQSKPRPREIAIPRLRRTAIFRWKLCWTPNTPTLVDVKEWERGRHVKWDNVRELTVRVTKWRGGKSVKVPNNAGYLKINCVHIQATDPRSGEIVYEYFWHG